MFTIDYLKENCQKIHFFGLGFVQLKINQHMRLHFYTTKYSSIVADTEFHNHRYNFCSKLLYGSLSIEVADFMEQYDESLDTFGPDVKCQNELLRGLKPTVIKVKESCNKDIKVDQEPKYGFLPWPTKKRLVAGNTYYCTHDRFHKVSTDEDTITLLLRSDYKKESAEVIKPIGSISVCPFSKELPEAELWEIVEEMWSKVK